MLSERLNFRSRIELHKSIPYLGREQCICVLDLCTAICTKLEEVHVHIF